MRQRDFADRLFPSVDDDDFMPIMAIWSFCWIPIMAIICLLAGGCASFDRPSEFRDTPGVIRRAICVGLTKVDPDYFGGWRGDCPGADVDADVMAMLCREKGLQTVKYLNAEATQARLIAAAKEAWKGMKAGDLLVIFISCHGGQQPDYSGDEADGYDETICLYDGALNDDYLLDLWKSCPAGVRVLFITDTCNSGTNYRYKPRKYDRAIPRSFNGQLIHFGGCADGFSSMGDKSGGIFTTALIDGWKDGQTYAEWWAATMKKMPKNQVPIYAEYGNVGNNFRTMEALK